MLVFLILCILTGIVLKLLYNSPNYKDKKKIGDIGESMVCQILSELGNEFNVLYNQYLYGYQIDHLVFYEDYIFVIETKCWGGIITGKKNDKRWMQNKNGVIKWYFNPIIQNGLHCKAVKRKYPHKEIIGIVVFVSNTRFPKYSNVISDKQLLSFVYNKINYTQIKALSSNNK